MLESYCGVYFFKLSAFIYSVFFKIFFKINSLVNYINLYKILFGVVLEMVLGPIGFLAQLDHLRVWCKWKTILETHLYRWPPFIVIYSEMKLWPTLGSFCPCLVKWGYYWSQDKIKRNIVGVYSCKWTTFIL